jgi:hypothetical protein
MVHRDVDCIMNFLKATNQAGLKMQYILQLPSLSLIICFIPQTSAAQPIPHTPAYSTDFSCPAYSSSAASFHKLPILISCFIPHTSAAQPIPNQAPQGSSLYRSLSCLANTVRSRSLREHTCK